MSQMNQPHLDSTACSAKLVNTTPVNTTPIDTTRQANRRAAWLWGTLIVGFLAAQVAIGVLAIVLATGDPSFAVVPDYHEKAIRWDEAAKAQATSDALGWHVEFQTSETADALGQRTVVVKLLDEAAQPIDEATVELRAFHHARAGEPVAAVLRNHGEGHYTTALRMQRDGLWQMELKAERGDDRFTITRTIDTEATPKL